jgi:hypothetical protein
MPLEDQKLAKPLLIAKPMPAISSNAARLSVFSGAFFVLILGSLHLLEPEFDPTWRLGILITGIFVTDPISVSPDAATFTGKMHAIGVTLDYTPVAALLISLALVRSEAWRPIRGRLFISSGIMFVAMVLFILQIPHDGQLTPDVLAGLFGRILIVSYLGWLLVVGFHALKLRKLSV